MLKIYCRTFNLTVIYRRNCDFKVEDRERDLSAQFIDMDEQFFTPTMTKYQEEYSKARPTSLYSVTPKESTSTSSSTRGVSKESTYRPKSSSSLSSSTRRSSAPFAVSPFKSPFLSSSPQTDSICKKGKQHSFSTTNLTLFHSPKHTWYKTTTDSVQSTWTDK